MHSDLAWLKGPIAGLSLSGSLAWASGLPWPAIFTGLGAAVPFVVGTYWGWRDRRSQFAFREEMRRLELKAAEKKLHATPGEQVRLEDFERGGHE